MTPDRDLLRVLHQTIQKVTGDTENLKFNTAISTMMELKSYLMKLEVRPRSVRKEPFVLLLPAAPHVAEELWRGAGARPDTLAYALWPKFDPELAKADEIERPGADQREEGGSVKGSRDDRRRSTGSRGTCGR